MDQNDIDLYKQLKALSDAGRLPATQKLKFARLRNQIEESSFPLEEKTETEAIKRQFSGEKKTYKLVTGREVAAFRTFVEAKDVEEKVLVHPDNPREQETLTRDNLWDILPFVEEYGVQNEGLACLGPDKLTFLAIDCSRRRMSAIYAQAGLPLWVIEDTNLTKEEVLGLIKVQEAIRKPSRREMGKKYVAAYIELGTYEAVFDKFKIPEKKRKTEERKLVAALIDPALINLFIDPHGIPNDYYTKLASIEKKIKAKAKQDGNDVENAISEFCSIIQSSQVAQEQSIDSEDIENSHQSTFNLIKYTAENKQPNAPTWSEPSYQYQASRTKFIRTSEHKSGRKFRAEFSYLTKSQTETVKQFLSVIEDEEKLKKIQQVLES
ncbi:hypothetical protein HUO09_17915 [Vibrio sp. Y2-5]|uniref:hypothetical protein n=1 Tax=Vibrio sp. Y2-5 TaxID=2743977 RepID=UPI001660BE74|nr:hypothetical protein [Vibrio sp. Y2-5]MBD0788236.1 hypothetical protein [Vibrio sp. Y2-5]